MSEAAHEKFLTEIVGLTLADRYVVERILGRGGMGVVAAGRRPELDQPVAIKFMWPEFAADEGLAKRFLHEGKVAAKVQSPHLVRVFDVGRIASGVPYLVMEMLAGHDLDEEMSKRGVLPLDEALDWFLQALVGMAEIHAQGIIHRDLKPANLFLAESGAGRTVKVLDFGISKDTNAKGEGLTSTETLLGTPQYMSPEQIKSSKNVDRRSDIWSLGVILYEILTGKLPFRSSPGSEGYGEVFGLVLFKDVEPPSKHRPGLPLELEAIVLKCLRKNPAERYQTVAALATALRPLVGVGSQHRIDTVRQSVPDLEAAAELDDEVSSARGVAVARTMAASAPVTPREPPPTAAPTTSRVVSEARGQKSGGARVWIGGVAVLATLGLAAVARTFLVSSEAATHEEPRVASAAPSTSAAPLATALTVPAPPVSAEVHALPPPPSASVSAPLPATHVRATDTRKPLVRPATVTTAVPSSTSTPLILDRK